jgi:hypothetical protein
MLKPKKASITIITKFFLFISSLFKLLKSKIIKKGITLARGMERWMHILMSWRELY